MYIACRSLSSELSVIEACAALGKRFGVQCPSEIEAPEALKVPSGVGYGEGCILPSCPLPSRLESLGIVMTLLQRGPGGKNAFWRILKVTQRSLSHLYADALSSSNSVLCHIAGGRPTFLGGAIGPCPT